MKQTYILLSRSILNSEVFASQKLLKIWIWCLCKASHKERYISLKVGRGERTIKVNRGQFIFGRFTAEEELFLDGSTIYKIMKRLEFLGNLRIQSNNQYSVITICNYNTYQDTDTYKVTSKSQVSPNQRTGKGQVSNTDNNVNNVKNVKDIKEVYSWWNLKEIIVHKKLTDEIKTRINTKLKDYSVEEICSSIYNYEVILNGDYYFKYKWTLKDFLQRGIDKFLDLDVAKSNYKMKPIDNKRSSRQGVELTKEQKEVYR